MVNRRRRKTWQRASAGLRVGSKNRQETRNIAQQKKGGREEGRNEPRMAGPSCKKHQRTDEPTNNERTHARTHQRKPTTNNERTDPPLRNEKEGRRKNTKTHRCTCGYKYRRLLHYSTVLEWNTSIKTLRARARPRRLRPFVTKR